MKLSVIIVNYNVKYFLEQAVLSVRKASKEMFDKSGYETEVFVVDNNSVDGSLEMLDEKFPEVKVIANKKNLGFSAANNQAIRISKGEYVLLLNPDTVVEEDTFLKCVRFMDQHPDAGGLGVKMVDGKGEFLPESKRGLPTPWVAFYKISGLASLFPKSKKFGKYHLGYFGEDDINEVEILSGAFMLMRKDALVKAGLLDETFFMYGEDIDLYWAGLYMREGNILKLGIFQGEVACTHIDFGRGVCGKAALEEKTVIVPDVSKFPGYIACHAAPASEIVVPGFVDGELAFVLDLDSTVPAFFTEEDAPYLEQVCETLSDFMKQMKKI